MTESFIIHVYRRDQAGLIVAGTVESVREGVKQPFANIEELWAYLNVHRERSRGPKASRRKAANGPSSPES